MTYQYAFPLPATIRRPLGAYHFIQIIYKINHSDAMTIERRKKIVKQTQWNPIGKMDSIHLTEK